MIPYGQALGDSGIKKTHRLNRKKPSAQSDSGKGSNLPRPVGSDGRETGQKTHWGREPELMIKCKVSEKG